MPRGQKNNVITNTQELSQSYRNQPYSQQLAKDIHEFASTVPPVYTRSDFLKEIKDALLSLKQKGYSSKQISALLKSKKINVQYKEIDFVFEQYCQKPLQKQLSTDTLAQAQHQLAQSPSTEPSKTNNDDEYNNDAISFSMDNA